MWGLSLNANDRDVVSGVAAARLWIPRLAAYTGAKIVELAALRREDCLHDEVGWSIRLNGWERLPDRVFRLHDAARRTLPLHRAVVAQGFPAIVESCPPGLLFAEDDASVARAAKTAMVGAKVGARSRLASIYAGHARCPR